MKQFEYAYERWRRETYQLNALSEKLRPFNSDSLKPYALGSMSLIEMARKCQLLTRTTVAEKLQISPTSLSELEKSERQGTLTIQSLVKVAEALDCEVILGLRHKSQLSFSQLIWRQVYPTALKHHWVRSRPMSAKGRALAAIARDLFQNAQFRKERGWSRKAVSED